MKRIRADPTSKRVFEEMQKKEKEEEERKAKLKAEGIVETVAVRHLSPRPQRPSLI